MPDRQDPSKVAECFAFQKLHPLLAGFPAKNRKV